MVVQIKLTEEEVAALLLVLEGYCRHRSIKDLNTAALTAQEALVRAKRLLEGSGDG